MAYNDNISTGEILETAFGVVEIISIVGTTLIVEIEDVNDKIERRKMTLNELYNLMSTSSDIG